MKMIVLDTNVVSALMGAEPVARVEQWLAAHTNEELATTSITVAEIGAGIELLPNGKRQRELRSRWQELLVSGFGERVFAFDRAAAVLYGELFARRQRAGRPADAFDLQIAAIALACDAGVATRNVRDFEGLGLRVHNPWSDPAPV